MRIAHQAAPFAGMTQTGSMGLISAAISRHPKPYRFIMGILVRFYKCAVKAQGDGLRWRNIREQMMAMTIMIPAPRNISGSRVPWA